MNKPTNDKQANEANLLVLCSSVLPRQLWSLLTRPFVGGNTDYITLCFSQGNQQSKLNLLCGLLKTFFMALCGDGDGGVGRGDAKGLRGDVWLILDAGKSEFRSEKTGKLYGCADSDLSLV